MKVCLLVARDPSRTEAVWVVYAADQDSLDEWKGDLPGPMRELVDADPANHRVLWVEIPNGSLERLWDAPTVTGTPVL